MYPLAKNTNGSIQSIPKIVSSILISIPSGGLCAPPISEGPALIAVTCQRSRLADSAG